MQTEVAEDAVTTEWLEVFSGCARYTRTTLYSEGSRYDACSVPEEATETLCTWMTALGHVCAVRALPVNWMSNQQLYQYCTSPGRRFRHSVSLPYVCIIVIIFIFREQHNTIINIYCTQSEGCQRST